ncbi:MAG: AsmA family protein [Alphaproteobacteria bacterium]|nr:AsmA family protein [Alphaproteobacteria bacterium]
MKKIVIGVLVVVVLAIGALLVAPSFIDWNAYRGEIAAEARKATGRALAIDGGIDVALLPAPKLSVAKVRLANIEGARDSDMVRLEALDLKIALWPLLSGKVVVQSVVLRGADIRLEKLADGRENWKFKPPEAGQAAGGDAGSPGSPGRAGDRITLKQVAIESSALSYRDSRRGSAHRVAGINARIAAATLAGPFAARGEFRYGAMPVAFELRSGRVSADASTKLELEARLPDAKAKIRYTGVLTPGKPSPTATGTLSAEGPDLGALLATLARAADPKAEPEPAPALAQPFTLTGTLAGGSEAFALNDVVAQMGGTRATGAANILPGDVTNIDATFKLGRLDLDSWLAKAGAAKAEAPGKAQGGTGTAAPFTLPGDISVALEAEVEGVVFRKGVIRDLGIRASMDKGVVRLGRLAARLPGGTEAQLSGRLRAEKGKPRFDGRVRMEAGDIRAVARWLGVDDGALPRDRLRKASYQAGLGFEPGRIEIRDMDLSFDSSRLTGAMVLALGTRIGIGARLKIDRLNVDAYLPTAAPGPGAAKDEAKAQAQPAPAGGYGVAALGAFDANFSIAAGRLSYRGTSIAGLEAAGALLNGDLKIDKLAIADLAGARIEAKGRLAKADSAPVPDLTLWLSAEDPRRLIRFSGLPLPIDAAKLGPLTVNGRVKAEDAGFRTDIDIAAGKISLAAKGTVAGLFDAPQMDLDLRLGHPDFITFMHLFDPAFRPEKPARGPFRLAAQIRGAGLDLKFEKLEAQLGPNRLDGAATLSLAALRPMLKADLTGDEIVLDHVLPGPAAKRPAAPRGAGPGGGARDPGGPPWSDEPIDVGMLKALDADLRVRAKAIAWRRWRVEGPRLDLTLEKGRLDMRRLTGVMVGGRFHMTGALAAPAKPGGALETRLDVDVTGMDLKQAMFNAADVDVAKGRVDFKMGLTGRGATSRAIAGSLDGSGALAARDGAVTGFDLARVNARLRNLSDGVSLISLLQTAMAGGTTRFSKLSGTFTVKRGVLNSRDVALEAEGGSGQGTLMVDIGRWLMDGQLTFRLAGNAEAPPFGLRLKGSLDQPRRIINANALQAWLASRAAGAIVNQFMGKPREPAGTAPDGGTQPPPSTKDQFIKGIFDILRK